MSSVWSGWTGRLMCGWCHGERRKNSSATSSRYALISSNYRSTNYGRQAELTYPTCNDKILFKILYIVLMRKQKYRVFQPSVVHLSFSVVF